MWLASVSYDNTWNEGHSHESLKLKNMTGVFKHVLSNAYGKTYDKFAFSNLSTNQQNVM